MVYVVDTVQVTPGDTPQYLKLLEDVYVPVMQQCGATFVGCWTTSPDLGEDVQVKTVFSFRDHVAWNDIRKNMVLSPDWQRFAREARALRKGGTRRFYYPVSFSPVQ